MRVFLVENSPPVRERLRALIQGVKGVEIVGEAASAKEALRMIAASGVDAVVLDIHLDDGNGFEVLRALRKSAPGIAVYMLTNFASQTYRSAAERMGARGFFDKSREIPGLLAVLSEKS
jgi:DNA-binding NarL/FixJ family response regulator